MWSSQKISVTCEGRTPRMRRGPQSRRSAIACPAPHFSAEFSLPLSYDGFCPSYLYLTDWIQRVQSIALRSLQIDKHSICRSVQDTLLVTREHDPRASWPRRSGVYRAGEMADNRAGPREVRAERSTGSLRVTNCVRV